MKKMIRKISLLLCAAVTLASCERKPLYDDCLCHSTLSIPVNIDWETSNVTPQNVTILFYNTADGTLAHEHIYEHNNKDIQSYAQLGTGSYKAVIFNELRNQIDYVTCVGHENISTLKFEGNDDDPLRSRSTTTRSYVKQPGILAVATVDNIVVTDDMIVEASKNGTTKSLSTNTKAAVESLMGVVPMRKNTTINITAHIKNIFYARMPALADLINLADGYYVNDDANSDITSTLQFSIGNPVYDDPSSMMNGRISATVTTFGTLVDRTSTSAHNDATPIKLDILFQQTDEPPTETALAMDVTDFMVFTQNSDGSVTIDIDVDFEEALPTVKPAGSSGDSGFGSNVADWETVDVPLEQN